MAVVAALAVAVSVIGVYGLMAFFAAARRNELAVRVALGATPGAIVRMLVRQAVRVVLFGLLPGVLVASVLSRLLQARVLDFMPNDLGTWAAALVLLLLLGGLAGHLPGRRAAATEPGHAAQTPLAGFRLQPTQDLQHLQDLRTSGPQDKKCRVVRSSNHAA